MRSHLLARRIISAPAFGLALLGALAAWGGSSTSSVSAPASTRPAASATALITANWEAFFSGKTSAAKKIALLQNGHAYAPSSTPSPARAWPARPRRRSPR